MVCFFFLSFYSLSLFGHIAITGFFFFSFYFVIPSLPCHAYTDTDFFSFKTQFLYHRLSEYAVSGRPVARDAALEMHNAIDGHWKVCPCASCARVCFFCSSFFSTDFCIDAARYHQEELHQRSH
jgi:hypothetical protein